MHGFSKEGGKRTLRLESRRERWIEEVERVNWGAVREAEQGSWCSAERGTVQSEPKRP